MILNMFNIVVAEAAQASAHQARSVGANGTGCGIFDDLCRFFKNVKILHFSFAF